jgi:hypothetical protein
VFLLYPVEHQIGIAPFQITQGGIDHTESLPSHYTRISVKMEAPQSFCLQLLPQIAQLPFRYKERSGAAWRRIRSAI